MHRIIADEHITLVDVGEEGPMRYGTMEFILDGPEVIYLSADASIEGMEMLLDNLDAQQIPEWASTKAMSDRSTHPHP